MGKIKSGVLTRANHLDAGLDVQSNEIITIPAYDSALISTGLIINIPKGHVGLLWSRSGLSVKHKLEVGAGCIDSGYHGEIKVHLYNHGEDSYTINIGERIAQLLTIPISLIEYEQVKEFEETSERGRKGFGSTGK